MEGKKYTYEGLAANRARAESSRTCDCKTKFKHESREACVTALCSWADEAYRLGQGVVITATYAEDVIAEVVKHLRHNGLYRATFSKDEGAILFDVPEALPAYYTLQLGWPNYMVCGTYQTKEEALAELDTIGKEFENAGVIYLVGHNFGQFYYWDWYEAGDRTVEVYVRTAGWERREYGGPKGQYTTAP